jgi:hypothetical protein
LKKISKLPFCLFSPDYCGRQFGCLADYRLMSAGLGRFTALLLARPGQRSAPTAR